MRMLSGDHPEIVAAVGRTLGFNAADCRGGITPEGKLDFARESATHGTTIMIGDGVNDAAALAAATVGIAVRGGAEASLAAADVSIAIGSIGSDAALESADIVLLADDLRVVPWAVGLARRTRRTIAFNLVFALSAIVVMAVATLVGSRIGRPLPLWLGVLGHEGGTLLVVANSLWLLAFRGVRGVEPPRTEETEPVRADTPAMAA